MSYTDLSPAQKAWETRRANGTAGPAGTAKVSAQSMGAICAKRPDSVTVEMHILQHGDSVHVTWQHIHADKHATVDQIPEAERPLASMLIMGTIAAGPDGSIEFTGHDVPRIQTAAGSMDLDSLTACIQPLNHLARFMAATVTETEDSSLEQTIAALAAHTRAWRLHFGTGAGSITVKRGAAYMAAHKYLQSCKDRFKAAAPVQSVPVQAAAPAPVKGGKSV